MKVLTILYVADLPGASRFYEVGLGWTKLVDDPNYVEYSCGVGLMRREAAAGFIGAERAAQIPTGVPKAELYVWVPDLDAATRRLVAAGAPCIDPAKDRSWGDRAAYYLDPEGHVVAVAQQKQE